ncbi:MAG: hypothetical protein KC591_13385 [Gemmatimonadetes bacterium]|nr:hypothetical protein [Gemmatimonadota bacterium]
MLAPMLHFLGSEIGRGHPFYLDGVRRALRASGRGDLIVRDTDVFAVSRGTAALAWRAVRQAYTWAGRGGVVSAAYHLARSRARYGSDSLASRVLGRDLRRWAGREGIVVVDHPVVAGALGDRPDIFYVHGEMVAPPESVATNAARIFVPVEDTAYVFVRGGVHPDRVPVTGVCVENELLPGAFDGLEARRGRIAGDGPLAVAFFSSGAEPPPHVRVITAGLRSLAAAGKHRAVVFARAGGRLESAVAPLADRVEIVRFRDRLSLDRLTASRFERFDVVVSPPHERSNWAVALGTPFLLVGPDIGPFAPRNRDLLLRRGVAVGLSETDAISLSAWIDGLRANGHLARMSSFSGGVSFRGFPRIAELLIAECERRRSA